MSALDGETEHLIDLAKAASQDVGGPLLVRCVQEVLRATRATTCGLNHVGDGILWA